MNISYRQNYCDLLKTLGHYNRFAIIEELTRNKCNVNSLVGKLGIPQTTVSQQLRLLRDHGIIYGTRKGTQVYYQIVLPLAKELVVLFQRRKRRCRK